MSTGHFEMTPEEQKLQEQLNAAAKSAAEQARSVENAFADSPEVQEITRLEGLITSKKTQLAGLGFFKGKEKKELQAQIDTLEGTLAEAKKKVSSKKAEIDGLKKNAEDAAKQAEEYGSEVMNARKKAVREQMFQIFGLNFSGKTVRFGIYEQGNGVEPIEWRVLERTDKGILLISQYAIDCKQYHKTGTDITWEKCDLRKWLNQEFLKTAFDEAEQSLIADTRCPADKNPKYNITPGNATTDKIFLLSIPEAEKYFKSNEDRKAVLTAYAKKQNNSAKTVAGEVYSMWWLRSPGYKSKCAAEVDGFGSVGCGGSNVNCDDFGVRPALWINLGS